MYSQVRYTSGLQDTIYVNNGNVGIGTRFPEEQLHIGGSLMIGDQLKFLDRPLGIGCETVRISDVGGSLVANTNLPTTLIDLDIQESSSFWKARVVGSGEDHIFDVDVDEEGNVVLVGATSSGTITFHHPIGTTSLMENVAGRTSMYVLKYDRGRWLRWMRKISTTIGGTNGAIVARSIAVDEDRNVYAVGAVRGGTKTFEGSSAPTFPSTHYGHLLVKYDENGEFEFANGVMTSTNNTDMLVHSVATYPNGAAVYVVGRIVPDANGVLDHVGIDKQGVVSSNTITTDTWGHSAKVGILTKYHTDGSYQWTRVFGTPGQPQARNSFIDVAVDDLGNVIAVGSSEGSASNVFTNTDENQSFSLPYEYNQPIVKYDASGAIQWVAGVPTHGQDQGVFGVACDSNQNIFVTGTFIKPQFGVLNGDMSVSTVSTNLLQNQAPKDCSFLMKLDPSGVYQWSVTMVARKSGNVVDLAARSVSLDSHGNIYVVVSNYYGTFYGGGGVHIEDTEGVEHVLPETTRGTNSRILKFSPQGTFLREVARTESRDFPSLIRGIAIDTRDDRNTVYAAAFTKRDSEVYGASNALLLSYPVELFDMTNGLAFAVTEDGGSNTPGPLTVQLPRQYNNGFKKDIYMTSSNANQELVFTFEDANGSYQTRPVTLEHSNVTLQKSYRWASSLWVPFESIDDTKRVGLSEASFIYGDQAFEASGSNYVGSTIQWDSATTDNKLAFRVAAKLYLASDTEIASYKFEALVTPVNDSGSGRPALITTTETSETMASGFCNITHDITRNSANAVDMRLGWDAEATDYTANLEVHVLASDRLGVMTFDPIRGV